MSEDAGPAMSEDAGPAMPDIEALTRQTRERAGTDADAEVVRRALGNALVIETQLYLKTTSTDDDLDLFFEVHGREPSDVREWPLVIMRDLMRTRPDPTTISGLADRAVTRAAGYIRDDSPLAFSTS